MKDMIPAGTGNSRFLKSIENFKDTFPDYAAFAQALENGTFPIDLNGLNPTGVAQQGTPLSKQTLLTDNTATALRLPQADPTVDNALDALASREHIEYNYIIGTSDAGHTESMCDFLCDGYNDEDEINAAIEALPDSGGSILILSGTYYIDATININKDNVLIKGAGTSTVLLYYDTINTPAINVQGTFCTLRDFVVDGGIKNLAGISAGTYPYSIEVRDSIATDDNPSNFSIYNVTITNVLNGIRTGTYSIDNSRYSKTNKIENCIFTQVWYNFIYVTRTTVDRCLFKNTYSFVCNQISGTTHIHSSICTHCQFIFSKSIINAYPLHTVYVQSQSSFSYNTITCLDYRNGTAFIDTNNAGNIISFNTIYAQEPTETGSGGGGFPYGIYVDAHTVMDPPNNQRFMYYNQATLILGNHIYNCNEGIRLLNALGVIVLFNYITKRKYGNNSLIMWRTDDKSIILTDTNSCANIVAFNSIVNKQVDNKGSATAQFRNITEYNVIGP